MRTLCGNDALRCTYNISQGCINMKTIDLSSLLDETILSVIEDIIEQNEAITVKAKNGNAVIMPFDDYKSLVESTYISSKHKLLKKIKVNSIQIDAYLAF